MSVAFALYEIEFAPLIATAVITLELEELLDVSERVSSASTTHPANKVVAKARSNALEKNLFSLILNLQNDCAFYDTFSYLYIILTQTKRNFRLITKNYIIQNAPFLDGTKRQSDQRD